MEEVEQPRIGEATRIELVARLLAQGRVAQAIGLLQQTLRQYSDSYEAKLTLGHTLLRLSKGDWALAEMVLRESARLKPDSFGAQFHPAVALQKLEKHRAAIECYDRAIALKPHHAHAHLNRGHCLKQLDDTNRARDS